MPHMTKSEWLSALNECGGDMSRDDIINLIYKDSPNAMFSSIVREKHVNGRGLGFYNYFSSFFPHRLWKDWSGATELGKVYHAAHIPFDLSIFQRSMQACSPGDANECHTDYCEIPQGGISNIPELEMYKAGFKTRPMCIANIRTSQEAKSLAKFIIDERFRIDEHVMHDFYVMAVIRMTGHKWLLEYEKDVNGNIIPIQNNNPYNMMQQYRYSYMEPLFPAPANVNNIMPMGLDVLEYFARGLVNSKNPNSVARGPRGEPIFELWAPDDWYKTEVLDNPEYIERNKYYMKSELIRGYTNEGGEREILGNFHIRNMPDLPRFAESNAGGLTVVQSMREVSVDSGNRTIHNFAEWDNAPILMMIAPSPDMGEILTRPSIDTGIEGKPIMPITGDGRWQYRNDYDKDCNEDLNMPHFRCRYEMGFRMKNPDAAWSFLYRARKFRLRPVNTCDLRPIIRVNSGGADCSILTIGCNPTNDRVSNNITRPNTARKILCGSVSCGRDTLWKVSFEKENQDSIAVNQSPIGSCGCGDIVSVFVRDEDGVFTEEVEAQIVEILRPTVTSPNWGALIELNAPLAVGECIGAVACTEELESPAIAIDIRDGSSDDSIPNNQVRMILSSPIQCDVGDSVDIVYKDSDGNILTTVAGAIIISINPKTNSYVFSSDGLVEVMDADQCIVTVECA